MTQQGRVGPPLPGVTSVELDGRACVFSPLSQQVLVLNETASKVWALVDGTRTLDVIVTDLAEAYAVPRQQILTDVDATIESFVTGGLINAPDVE